MNILKREGVNVVCMAQFYLIVQAVLLYGLDLWVLNKRALGKLESFYHRAVRHMTGDHIQKVGIWSGSIQTIEKSLLYCNLFSIRTYLERRRGTLWNYLRRSKTTLEVIINWKVKGIKNYCGEIKTTYQNRI